MESVARLTGNLLIERHVRIDTTQSSINATAI